MELRLTSKLFHAFVCLRAKPGVPFSWWLPWVLLWFYSTSFQLSCLVSTQSTLLDYSLKYLFTSLLVEVSTLIFDTCSISTRYQSSHSQIFCCHKYCSPQQISLLINPLLSLKNVYFLASLWFLFEKTAFSFFDFSLARNPWSRSLNLISILVIYRVCWH